MNAEEIKTKWAAELKKAAAGIEYNDKLQVCINQNISTATFDRYTGGNYLEVRRLELADPLLQEIKKVRAASAKKSEVSA